MNVRHYDFIDALRGYAILGVIAVHVAHLSTDLGENARAILYEGARGVQLFFVASALTLFMSWHTRKDGLISFYIRRFFRIAPMFWLALIFYVCMYLFGLKNAPYSGVNSESIFLTMFFLNAWFPRTIYSLVPGGWSISVEMTFYLIFPFVIKYIKNMRSALVWFALSYFFYKVLYHFALKYKSIVWAGFEDYLISVFLYHWVPNQLPVFFMGFILYFLIKKYKGKMPKFWSNILLLLSISSVIIFSLYPSFMGKFYLTNNICYGATFVLFAFCLADGAGKWLVNLPVRYLGKISFSIYLWHFAAIDIVNKVFLYCYARFIEFMPSVKGELFFLEFFSCVLLLSVVISIFTYKFVELPMIKVGSSIANRFKSY